MVVLRQSLAEQVHSARQGASLAEQQRDSKDSIDKSLSSLCDAIVNVVSFLNVRFEHLVHMFIATRPIELGCSVFGRTR